MSLMLQKLVQAKRELACPTCGNNPRGHMGGECPECHGEHRHTATIELLDALVDHATGYVRKVNIKGGR